MPTRQSVEQLRAANQGISKLIVRDLEGFWSTLNLNFPEAARDALLAFMPELTTKYGDIAATVSADWFDEERALANVPGVFRADMAPTVAVDAVTNTVRYAAGGLFNEDPTSTLGNLSLAAAKYALQPGRDTIAHNSIRDNARWARIPTGAKTCAFCLVMASRGFVYGTQSTAGQHDSYHGDCDCVAVPSWSHHPAIEGYDPAHLYSQYLDARKASGSGDLPEILSELRVQQGIS